MGLFVISETMIDMWKISVVVDGFFGVVCVKYVGPELGGVCGARVGRSLLKTPTSLTLSRAF